MTDHTPTPWETTVGGKWVILKGGENIAQCYGPYAITNAKLIVRAVNARDELIEALRSILNSVVLVGGAGIIRDSPWVTQARAALKHATEEPAVDPR